MELTNEATQTREPTYPVHSHILGRWSPRSMSGEALTDEELLPLFEAARWAPSSYNNQPWRFIIAQRDTPEWEKLFGLMVEFNQQWTKNAAALVMVISHKVFEYNGKPSRTHSHDTGAASENLAIEAAVRGLVVHQMEGFDYEKAREVLKIPSEYNVESMLAIGKPGKKKDLPEEMQKKEEPSKRKPLKELLFLGEFGTPYLK